MKVKTEKFLNKFIKKDYNNELEEILSQKDYDEEVKNLLLDILYKIETSYKDYSKVKINVLSQEKYIENIINIVKNYCDSIRFIAPSKVTEKEDKTVIVSKEKKEILCYPIARKILYSLSEIKKSDDIIKSQFKLLNKALTNTINIGNNINTEEPYRDFNGFSWNITTSEIENFYYNLIYQDLIILVGNQFLEEWVNQNESIIDYTELFKSDLENKYGKKIKKNILELLNQLSIFMEISLNKSFKTEVRNKKKELEKKLKKMNNKESYLEEISSIKKKLTKEIKEIDIIVNNKKLLKKEYKKRNTNLPLEQKLLDTKVLAKKMIKQRNEILHQIEDYNKLMNPKNYRAERDFVQKEYKYVRLIETENINEEIYKDIILLQKEVLRSIKIKAENTQEKKDLLKIIYEMRYLNLIPVNDKKNISKLSELTKMLSITKKEILSKAYELKLINPIFGVEKYDYEIFKHIFSLNIISLEDIYLKIYKEKEEYYVQFFDEDIIDEKFKLNIKPEKDLKNIKKGKEPIFKK